MLTTERNARGHKLKTQGQTKPQVYVVHGKKTRASGAVLEAKSSLYILSGSQRIL